MPRLGATPRAIASDDSPTHPHPTIARTFASPTPVSSPWQGAIFPNVFAYSPFSTSRHFRPLYTPHHHTHFHPHRHAKPSRTRASSAWRIAHFLRLFVDSAPSSSPWRSDGALSRDLPVPTQPTSPTHTPSEGLHALGNETEETLHVESLRA